MISFILLDTISFSSVFHVLGWFYDDGTLGFCSFFSHQVFCFVNLCFALIRVAITWFVVLYFGQCNKEMCVSVCLLALACTPNDRHPKLRK